MRVGRNVEGLIAILDALRTPGTGCPWDLQQTHSSLAPYAIEEAYEVVDAIERGDPHDLRDELGDYLLQVVFHARLAAEAGTFDFGDVVEAVTAKMVRRHPHVFPPQASSSPDDDPRVDVGPRGWDAIKASERALRGGHSGPIPGGLLAGIPAALPGLTRAVKLQARAATVGFDWDDPRLVLAKIREELDEVERELLVEDVPASCLIASNASSQDASSQDASSQDASGREARLVDVRSKDALTDEIGDLLFTVANLARHVGVDPETAARSANAKFERRFAVIERELAGEGLSLEGASLARMEALWQEAKRRERADLPAR